MTKKYKTETAENNTLRIYLITNTVNGKRYIGQTVKSIETRFREHVNTSNSVASNGYNYVLHQAIRKYGTENFKIELLEDGIATRQEADEAEQKYINQYRSGVWDGNGYNMTSGGKSCPVSMTALPAELVSQVRKDIIETNVPLAKIAQKYNVHKAVIYAVNQGRSYYCSSLDYPLRRIDFNSVVHIGIDSQQTYNAICNELENLNLSTNEIAKKYNVCRQVIDKVNYGDDTYVQRFNAEPSHFPLRMSRSLTGRALTNIIKEMIFSDKTASEISKQYGHDRKLASNLSNGSNFRNPFLLYPISSRKEANRKIVEAIGEIILCPCFFEPISSSETPEDKELPIDVVSAFSIVAQIEDEDDVFLTKAHIQRLLVNDVLRNVYIEGYGDVLISRNGDVYDKGWKKSPEKAKRKSGDIYAYRFNAEQRKLIPRANLVAKAFIKNEDGQKYVRHIGNTLDDSVSNLVWTNRLR